MINIPQRVLGEALINAEKSSRDKIALVFEDKEYSYGELLKFSVNLARYLVSSGIKKGDRVAIFMNNSWQCAVSVYGVTLAGGVFLLINPQTKADKLHYIISDSGARILITERLLLNTLYDKSGRNIIPEIMLVSKGLPDKVKADDSGYGIFEESVNDFTTSGTLPNVIPSDLAALIYTSGSTGFPKGVMMTHQSMVFTAWSLIEYLRLTDNERIMLVLPLAFDYGLYQLFMTVTTGSTLIIEHSFSFPGTIYKHIVKLRPTVFPGVPTIFALMISAHRKSGLTFNGVRTITNTAAKLPGEFIPELKKMFPGALIFKMYGLTECKRVSYLEPELVDIKPGSVGRAIPGTEVFLLDSNGQAVPPGTAGILHVRGPHVMAGYWKREEMTREMLKVDKITGEKVLCTGDLFKMDEEGFLYFLGRTDDIIKTRGEKVSPLEIENIIYRLKGIKEVAVVGIPDALLGESIIAFATLHSGSKACEEDIIKICTENSELFMVPQKVHVIDEMPKSSNGKIDRLELKRIASC